MKKLNKYLVVFLILVLAATLRLYKLGETPASPDWDEVALGYNAYSVLKTGRDEYGTRLPMSLRSYDDYKPPFYMYLTIPSVDIFGLNVWSVRLPSAIFGVLAVLGTYLLVGELITYGFTLQTKDKKQLQINKLLPLLTALLLAISPWHLQFSRIAFEANIGLTINIWAVYFILHGLLKRNYLVIGAFLSGLGLYAYHSERVFLPLLLVIIFFIFKDKLFNYKKFLFVPIIVGLITVIPLLSIFSDKNTLLRLKGTSSLSDQTGLLSQSVSWLMDDKVSRDFIGYIVDNRRIVWVKTIISGYLSHFSFNWWFINGDNPRHHAPDTGQLYLFELPFMLIGMYQLFKNRSKATYLMFGWFFIAPIAASPTTELPHAIRTLVFLPTFQMFTALGITKLLLVYKQKNNLLNKILLVFTCLFAVFNIVYYFDMYYHHMDKEYSKFWQYGYKQAVDYANANKNKYQKIVVSTKLEQPYMFFLFYLKYDPIKYLRNGGTASGGFAEKNNKFDKYEFRQIDSINEIRDGSALYIGKPGEISGSPLEVIHYLDGSDAITISDR